jgi:hypothetical protein
VRCLRRVTPQEFSLPGLYSRIITVCGKLDAALRAVALIAKKMAEDKNYSQYLEVPFKQSVAASSLPVYGSAYALPQEGSVASPSDPPQLQPGYRYQQFTTISVEVQESQVGQPATPVAPLAPACWGQTLSILVAPAPRAGRCVARGSKGPLACVGPNLPGAGV